MKSLNVLRETSHRILSPNIFSPLDTHKTRTRRQSLRQGTTATALTWRYKVFDITAKKVKIVLTKKVG